MVELISKIITDYNVGEMSREQAVLFFLTILAILLLLYEVILYIVLLLKGKKIDLIPSHLLKRHGQNPVLSPLMQMDWQGQGTCNPAAYMDDTGKVHIIYRAIGNDGVSRLGYASSPDGFFFEDVHPWPVFSMQHPERYGGDREKVFNPTLYPSGGSWGGCEDPRMVAIDDRIYVSFSVFGGWDYIRLAVASISKEDFLAKRWNWSKPIFLSPVGEVNKNWVLFPEKIDGKFAILHSISPEPQVDFVEKLEDLNSGKKKIKSKFGQKTPRTSWDTWLRGTGPSPVRTDKGWLVLYHATNIKEPHKYQVGAMLLDINKPNIIIARSPAALLISDKWYENDWKPGVVYVCGAVVKDNSLLVYYGGGDKHVCVAETNLEDLLNWLMSHGINK